MVYVLITTIYRQPDDFSCGPTTLKTLMEHYGDGSVDVERLKRIAGTTRERGTPFPQFIDLARRLQLNPEVKEQASRRDLVASLERGDVPIVRYLIPETGDPHYSLVVGVEGNRFTIADSETGDLRTYTEKDFMKGWNGLRPPRCMLTIRKTTRGIIPNTNSS